MAAAAEVVMSDCRNQSVEAIASERLDEWNRWMNGGPKVGPQEPTCTLGRVKEQRVAAGMQGGEREMPKPVEEVENVVRRLSLRAKKLVETYYDHSPMHIKAKECGLSYSGYWRAIQRLRRHVYSELY